MTRSTFALLSIVVLGLFVRPRECAAGIPDDDVEDPPAISTGDPKYAAELVAQAHALHLDQDEQWLRLGHWRGGIFGKHGEADGPAFWLASDGQSNPSAELDATLRGFWAPEPTDESTQHPFCRFPARRVWLDSKLHFDARRMPQRRCARFEHWLHRLRPGSASIIFSSYYLNNPASAFGHTFLRIHKADSSRTSDLLDTGVDFSANVHDSNVLVYALKGLTGLYPGVFRALPYYYKVREYNDYESRDLWEYELNLSERALAMLVAHLWEEGATWFNYYYLSENCSYHVLATIEAAEPSAHLLEHVKWPVLPTDTVRVLLANQGLVRTIQFRPSLRTKVRQQLDALQPEERDMAARLVDSPDAPFPPAMSPGSRAHALESASDLVDVQHTKAMLKEDDPYVARLKQRLLERRAEIAIVSDSPAARPPLDKLPTAGHSTARLRLGTGYSQQLGGDFLEIGHRLALHDLGDPPDGYPETSQIEFLPFRVRAYPKQKSLELEDLSLVRIMSLSPWQRFWHPMSWAVRAGAGRVRDDGCQDCVAGVVEVAGGFTTALGADDTLAMFLMGNVGLQYAAGMHGLRDSDWRPGVGPIGGVRWRLGHSLVWLTDARWSWLPLAAPQSTWLGETSLRWQIARDVALGAELRTQPGATEGVLSAFLYY